MKSNSRPSSQNGTPKTHSRKSPNKKPPLPLDLTMKQLKDALERWQSPAHAQRDSGGKRGCSKSGDDTAIDSEWIEETRSLLKQLNRQLNELSR